MEATDQNSVTCMGNSSATERGDEAYSTQGDKEHRGHTEEMNMRTRKRI